MNKEHLIHFVAWLACSRWQREWLCCHGGEKTADSYISVTMRSRLAIIDSLVGNCRSGWSYVSTGEE